MGQIRNRLDLILNSTSYLGERLVDSSPIQNDIFIPISVNSTEELLDAINGTNRVIYLENNTYDGPIQLEKDNIKLISKSKWGAKIDGHNSSSNLILNGVREVSIEGINFTNSLEGIELNKSNYCNIRNNRIYISKNGIILKNSSFIYLEFNDISFVGRPMYTKLPINGIYMEGAEENHILANKINVDKSKKPNFFDINLYFSNRNVIVMPLTCFNEHLNLYDNGEWFTIDEIADENKNCEDKEYQINFKEHVGDDGGRVLEHTRLKSSSIKGLNEWMFL